jgi:hypothetical protein
LGKSIFAVAVESISKGERPAPDDVLADEVIPLRGVLADWEARGAAKEHGSRACSFDTANS